jgi:hypothetical protein
MAGLAEMEKSARNIVKFSVAVPVAMLSVPLTVKL